VAQAVHVSQSSTSDTSPFMTT